MLLTVTPLENPGPPSPIPPPTPPKPRKDNAKLQRLLRKAAKKSAAQTSPTLTTKTFRSTLSPVSEADLESIESAAPQKHKKPPAIILPPRFQIKGVTHRVPSPYPKQKFTFTVSEQQSLSQYLSPSPVPDSASPLPFRPTSPNTPFLYPPGGNTADRLSPRVIANSSPRPCTPKAVETSQKQTVHHVQILTTPTIIVLETSENDVGPPSPKKEESVNETKVDRFSTPKCEDTKLSKGSNCPKSIPVRPDSTNKPSACSPGPENEPIKPDSTSTTSEMAHKDIVEEPSKVVEISHNKSTHDTRTTIVSETSTTVNSTDNPDGQSKVTVKTVHLDINISSKTTGPTNVTPTTVTNSETAPKTEALTILKPPEKPKPPRKKPGGGWARLVKHLVIEPEEPKFPEQQKAEDKTGKSVEAQKATTEGTQESKSNRANKMWDALLYRMATTTKEPEKPGQTAPPPLPFFRSRLPLLLHRPRFDARKLKEAAARPLRRVTAFFHRRVADKTTPGTFNRTASGWSIRDENAEDEKKAIEDDTKQ
ncbi:proline-rich protein 33 isoform 1-T2 [Leptodactylus fuscus]|uniref:proline-rich protein 33 n=1 Tax=Leptodactylus fuscus TaxID=238119 RepID=UPI003F4F3018